MADINVSSAKKRKKKKKKNSSLKSIIILLLFSLALITMGYARYSNAIETSVVGENEIKNIVSAKGISVFSEELITSEKKGVSIINYSDGTRIVANTHAATIYTGDVDEGKSSQISELNEKINYLETSRKNLQEKEGEMEKNTHDALVAKMSDIAYYSEYGSLESLQRESSEILSIVAGSNTEDLTGQLEELIKKRDDLENSITGDKEEYIAKSAGTIYSAVDGYETTLTKDSLKDVTADSFKTIWNSKPVDYEKSGSHVYGRIINDFEANIIACLSTKDAEGLKEGTTYQISLSENSSSTIPATVQSISSEKRQTVVVFTVMKNAEDFLAERKFEFYITKSSYKGLSVPTEAVFDENGEKKVWVIKDGVVNKKTVEILGKGDGFTLVKEDNSNSGNLLLYDSVITSYNNISEGMIVTDYQ